MGYDKTFYELYDDYLNEPAVVRAHTFAISLLGSPPEITDFGCGMGREVLRRIEEVPFVYLGVDANVESGHISSTLSHVLIKGNYRDEECMKQVLSVCWGSDTFTSLFSTEITAPPAENYKLYERLFRRGFKTGLVSGFYYASKRDQNPIGETGGIMSWQTLEQPDEVLSDLFIETRIVMPVPSKMFGPDVYEVWKLFKARQ